MCRNPTIDGKECPAGFSYTADRIGQYVHLCCCYPDDHPEGVFEERFVHENPSSTLLDDTVSP